MNKAYLSITVHMDEKRVPTQITWSSSDDLKESKKDTHVLHLAVWEEKHCQTEQLFLWTKDFPAHEMKRFYIDTLSSLAQGILNATGDTYMSQETQLLCERLAKRYESELKSSSRTQ